MDIIFDKNATYNTGFTGENKALILKFFIPSQMYNINHYYRLFFSNGLVSNLLTPSEPEVVGGLGTITYELKRENTSQPSLSVQLEEYDNDDLIRKSNVVSFKFETSLSKSKEIFFDNDLILEVNQNSMARHTHTNLELLNSITEDDLGGGIKFVNEIPPANGDKIVFLKKAMSTRIPLNYGEADASSIIEFIAKDSGETISIETTEDVTFEFSDESNEKTYKITTNNSAVSPDVRNFLIEVSEPEGEAIFDNVIFITWVAEAVEHEMFGSLPAGKWLCYRGNSFEPISLDDFKPLRGKLVNEYDVSALNEVWNDIRTAFDVYTEKEFSKGLLYSEENTWHQLTEVVNK